MGNNHSHGIVCCVGPTHTKLKEEKLLIGKSEKPGTPDSGGGTTEKTSIASSMNEPVENGYSFSSISSKSSTGSGGKEQTKENTFFTPDEMRNDDTEWCHSISDEIRVAESSYDEATTEAVNHYYGDSRYSMTYNTNRDDTVETREQ